MSPKPSSRPRWAVALAISVIGGAVCVVSELAISEVGSSHVGS